MSKLHVLEQLGLNRYRIVVHQATPVGSNSAGVSWATAIVNSGRATSVMPAGSGAGQIESAELTAVQNGTTLEGVFEFQDDPAWSTAQRNAALDAAAAQTIAELQSRLAFDLKFFGFVRA
jgi:hypothetical protein